METQKWWARIVNEDKERRKDRGESGSRQLCGLPATWAANSFKTFWLQSFAMVQARTQANSIDVWVRKSAPLRGTFTKAKCVRVRVRVEDISAKTRASSENPLNNSCYLVGIG